MSQETNTNELQSMLSSIERFNPGNLDFFLEETKTTIEQGTYNLDLYLAIFKLFQFNPSRFDAQTARTVLLKCLCGFPNNDTSLCLALMNEQQLACEEVQQVVQLNSWLETCNFAKVWAFLKEHPDFTKCKMAFESEDEESDDLYIQEVDIKDFEQGLRKFAIHIVNVTYSRVDSEVLKDLLNVEGDEIKSVADASGWTIDGTTVIVNSKKAESQNTRNIIDTISFKSLVPVLAASQKRS